jgi:hypothetical protein
VANIVEIEQALAEWRTAERRIEAAAGSTPELTRALADAKARYHDLMRIRVRDVADGEASMDLPPAADGAATAIGG